MLLLASTSASVSFQVTADDCDPTPNVQVSDGGVNSYPVFIGGSINQASGTFPLGDTQVTVSYIFVYFLYICRTFLSHNISGRSFLLLSPNDCKNILYASRKYTTNDLNRATKEVNIIKKQRQYTNKTLQTHCFESLILQWKELVVCSTG